LARAANLAEQLLTFQLGKQNYAVPTALVREVTTLPRTARVPRAPAAMLGLANLRGDVIPVLSLSRLLDLEDQSPPKRLIVVDIGELVGLAVDTVSQGVAEEDVSTVRRLDVATLIGATLSREAAPRSTSGIIVTRETGAARADQVRLVTFMIGNQDFAIPLESVKEVLRVPADIAHMPHADAVVLGSTLVRGALLPLLSLHGLLALPARETTDRSRILIVLIGSHCIGLLVDRIRDILQVDESDIDPVPHVLSRGNAEARIQAICRIQTENRLISVLATEHLVRDDITARLLHGDGEGESDMAQGADEADSEQFVLFRVGGDEFGIAIGSVEEVVALPTKLTPLPRAPAFVQGVMNVRGAVVPVIDQSLRFNGTAGEGARRRVLVVRIGEMQAGFIVDSVSQILRIPADALRAAPDLGGDETRLFERVANLPQQNKILLIVSPRELLDRTERELLASLAAKVLQDQP
jgi:purine-binding chemotaxis protein CheW